MEWTQEQREQEKRKFYNAIILAKPLDYSDENERSQYIKGLHGENGAVDRLLVEIDMREAEGVFLFSGQPASGKSTEMLRLKHRLETEKGVQKVYYLDLAEYLNPSEPIEFGGFVLAILVAWLELLKKEKVKLGEQNYLQRLQNFLSKTEVTLDGIEIGSDDFGTLRMSLKTDEGFRTALHQAIQKRKTHFIGEMHTFIGEIYGEIAKSGEKCVLLVDSIEKIQGTAFNTKDVYESVSQLFSRNAHALKLPFLHVVYSIPPYVLEQNRNLPALLGGAASVQLPSVHVFKKKSCDPDDTILNLMVELISKRYPQYHEFFNDTQIKTLAEKSGGKLRDFLRAIHLCLLEISTRKIDRVDEECLKLAQSQIKPTNIIPTDIWQWLKKIDETHQPSIGNEIDALTLEKYLTTQHVLVYLNGDAWYGVHPLLRDELNTHVHSVS
ncbi:MAG: hypothetical protein AB7E49_11045 [Campylobacterales bacterium]